VSQSAWIAATIVAAFLLFLALRGKLNAYWSLLIGGGAPAGSPGAQPASGGGASSTAPTSPLDIAGGLVGGIAGGGAAGAAGSNLPGGASSTTTGGTVSGTVTGSGQTSTQQWSVWPGVLPPLPQVVF